MDNKESSPSRACQSPLRLDNQDTGIGVLEADEELGLQGEVDCGKTDNVTVELRSGHAEIFGTELVETQSTPSMETSLLSSPTGAALSW